MQLKSDRRTWRSGRNAEEKECDVVRATAFESHRYKFLAGVGGGIGAGDAGEVGVVDQAPETVGAEKKNVALFQRDGVFGNVRSDVAAGAESGGEDVALGVRLGVFGADNAAFDQATNVRMVASEAGNRFGANEVEATVTDMGEMKPAIDDRERCAGRAHSVELGMIHREALNILVRRFKGFGESQLWIIAESIVIDLAYGLDGKATGFLTALVSAHTVGDDGESALAAKVVVGIGLPVEIGIFVIGALAADIGQARGFDAGLGGFGVNCHRWGEQVLI